VGLFNESTANFIRTVFPISREALELEQETRVETLVKMPDRILQLLREKPTITLTELLVKIWTSQNNPPLAMSTVEQIEAAILKLSPQELSQLADWVLDLDEQRWDEQIERDVAAGKLDFLAQEALTEFEAGNCRTL
jgi:hypothetical protein